MKNNTPSGVGISLVALVLLGLSACATHQEPSVVASVYGASSDTQIVASGPVADSDAAMKQRPGTHQTANATSSTKDEETETRSTETTTVVGSSAVAAPDSEVKFSNQ